MRQSYSCQRLGLGVAFLLRSVTSARMPLSNQNCEKSGTAGVTVWRLPTPSAERRGGVTC
jgi:hypothetical protein